MSRSFICIVASHYRTPLWIKSAKKISPVIVICRNRDDLNFASDLCNTDDIIINLTDDKINSHACNIELIHKFEEMHNVSLMTFVISDRRLRHFSKKKLELYFSFLITEFNKINFDEIIFSMSEPTWFHERLFLLYCGKKNINSIHLRPDRYAHGRFNIFIGEDYKFIVRNNLNTVSNEDLDIYEEIISGSDMPRDFDKVKNRNFITTSKIKSLLFLIKFYLRKGGSTFIHQSFFMMIMNKIINISRGYYLRYFYRFSSFPKKSSSASLLLLHMQPEQSIDVANWQYSDQVNTVRRVRERLPSSITLYVKDHPHCAGMRSLNYYKPIKELPNTKILNPFIDTKSLLSLFSSVYSASGTGVFEAGVKGIACGCFNSTFFDGVCWSRLNLEYSDKLPYLINFESVANDQIKKTLRKILQCQFPGDVRDMLRDDSIMSEGNIENVSLALSQLKDNKDWDLL